MKKDKIHLKLNSRYPLKITTDQLDKARAKAREEGKSLAEFIRNAIGEKLKREKTIELYLEGINKKIDRVLEKV